MLSDEQLLIAPTRHINFDKDQKADAIDYLATSALLLRLS
jgi:hypothetical protein